MKAKVEVLKKDLLEKDITTKQMNDELVDRDDKVGGNLYKMQLDRRRKFAKIKLAEGVVSAPFLPSDVQGHKGGFAALPKWTIIG